MASARKVVLNFSERIAAAFWESLLLKVRSDSLSRRGVLHSVRMIVVSSSICAGFSFFESEAMAFSHFSG